MISSPYFIDDHIFHSTLTFEFALYLHNNPCTNIDRCAARVNCLMTIIAVLSSSSFQVSGLLLCNRNINSRRENIRVVK